MIRAEAKHASPNAPLQATPPRIHLPRCVTDYERRTTPGDPLITPALIANTD